MYTEDMLNLPKNTAKDFAPLSQWCHDDSLMGCVQYFISMKRTNTVNRKLCASMFICESNSLSSYLMIKDAQHLRNDVYEPFVFYTVF